MVVCFLTSLQVAFLTQAWHLQHIRITTRVLSWLAALCPPAERLPTTATDSEETGFLQVRRAENFARVWCVSSVCRFFVSDSIFTDFASKTRYFLINTMFRKHARCQAKCEALIKLKVPIRNAVSWRDLSARSFLATARAEKYAQT